MAREIDKDKDPDGASGNGSGGPDPKALELAPDDGCGWPPVLAAMPPEGATTPDDDVRRLQELLKGHGWFAPPVATGFYDVYTEQAVQKLQRACQDAGVTVGPIDGQFNAATRLAACAVFTL